MSTQKAQRDMHCKQVFQEKEVFQLESHCHPDNEFSHIVVTGDLDQSHFSGKELVESWLK